MAGIFACVEQLAERELAGETEALEEYLHQGYFVPSIVYMEKVRGAKGKAEVDERDKDKMRNMIWK
jgi:hypothetical protein